MTKLQVIEPSAIVNVPIGTDFYRRIQNLALFIMQGKSMDELKSAIEQINTKNITEDWVEHYHTVLMFCAAYEKLIIDNDLIKEVEGDD